MNQVHFRRGFSFVELIVATAVFAFVSVSVYQGYLGLLALVELSRIKVTVTALANEQFEIARNLPYAEVGLINGVPAGSLPRFQTFMRDGFTFQATTTVRNIDDPFDGLIGEVPNDLSPADYKLVEIEIGCSTCRNFVPMFFTTTVAPKNLETASTNGALFVRVFDANGAAVSGARVQVANASAVPAIAIDEVTNAQGVLQLVDVPPGSEVYEIIVSKAGYSTEETSESGLPGNPNPTKPHATVALQQVTQTSFIIDRTGTLNFRTVDAACTPIGNVDFTLKGTKLIGTEPDVLKYSSTNSTNGSGESSTNGLEWDTYNPTITDLSYDLAGSISQLPVSLAPGASQDVTLVVVPTDPRTLLVTVKDAASGLPITDASVTGVGPSLNTTLITGRGFLRQSDWSGGAGVATSTGENKFLSSDGGVEYGQQQGELLLKEFAGSFVSSGELISSTFDTGSTSNFYQILWTPTDQPAEVGAQAVRLQIATNNDGGAWDFKGPDGTDTTFYTPSDQNIAPVHNGDRYLRYKVFLQTEDSSISPNISDVAFTFTSACVPPGQVRFSGLTAGTYDISITKPGYQTYQNDSVEVSSDWQNLEVLLQPE